MACTGRYSAAGGINAKFLAVLNERPFALKASSAYMKNLCRKLQIEPSATFNGDAIWTEAVLSRELAESAHAIAQ